MMKLLLLCGVILVTQWVRAQSPISGIVVDEHGTPIPGALISLNGSFTSTVTETDGGYTLTSQQAFPWTVHIISEGYISRTQIIYAEGEQVMVSLKPGVTPGESVSFTASKKLEKSSSTAIPTTILHSRELQSIPLNGDPIELLRNIAGVNLVRSGTESTNIELRGAVNLLETSTLILKDFAPITAIADKALISVASSLSPLDIDRVEMVNGPQGVLYGPNASSGVIHYITKDAFQYPGISAMVSGGERNLLSTRVRYAGNNGRRLGWKFLANYSQSEDFTIAADQMMDDDGVSSIITPQNFQTLGGKRWNNVTNLDAIRLYNWSFEGGLEFRPKRNTRLNYTASISRARTNLTAGLGHFMLGLQRFEQQAKLEMGNLFASIYHRHNFANVSNNGGPNRLADYAFLFNYTHGIEGQTQLAPPQRTENYVDIIVQYQLHLTEQLEFLVGTEAKLSPAFEYELVYGGNSANNAYNTFGGFITGKYQIHQKLQLHAAGRYDYLEAFDTGAFSPRSGLVYTPKRNVEVRLNYSRSVNAPSRQSTWKDYNLSSVLPSFYPATRVQGFAQEVSFNHPVTRFSFGDVAGGELFDLQDIIDAAAAHAGVPAPVVSGTIDPAITTASYAAPMVGFPTGFPITIDQQVTGPFELSYVNQIELGFSHTLKQKLQINTALYHSWIEHIPYSSQSVLSAGSQLNLLEISNILEQQVPSGPERDAIITALYSVPANPEDPDYQGVPGFGVVMSDRAQRYQYTYDLGVPGYNSKNVSYYGADISATYHINAELSVFGNYAYLSQTEWTARDLEETNPDYGFYLNSAPDRMNVGINYYPNVGIYGSVALNYQSAYESRQGDGTFFSGPNEARSIVDLQLGYRFGMFDGILFDAAFSVNNLFDEKYSHFRNLGQLSRFGALSLKVSL